MQKLILSRHGIEPNIEITESNFFVLSIEEKTFLLNILLELKTQIEGGADGDFSLLQNQRLLNISKSVSAIFDFTDINFNSKAISNLLIKKFSEYLTDGKQLENLTDLERTALNLIDDFREYSGINVEGNSSMTGANLAKTFSLKISDDKKTLLERLCEYVNLLCDLMPLKLFVLVFAKAFLSSNEIDDLYKYCCDKAVRLLIFESDDKSEVITNERRLVIDKDLCTILQGDWGEN